MRIKLSRYMPHFFVMTLFSVMFSGFLLGDKVLMGTDAVISNANRSVGEVWSLIESGWRETPLLGKPSGAGINFLRLLLLVFRDGILWNNWYHGLACLFASFFFLRYFRKAGVCKWAAVLSVLAAFWMGVNLTIVYAGHPAKPYIVMLFAASLIPVSKAVHGSMVHSLLWGGCVGLMFVHQADVAMFFALFAGVYFVFCLFQELGFTSPMKWGRVLVPALVFAFVFACGPLIGGYKAHVQNSVQTQVQTSKQKWDYVTQWSFPPEESIAFIAPGYTGWRSGESEGPYWGRMGRSAGWEETHQGFQNFKLENMYIGFIPVAFAFFAIFSCRRSEHRAEILFWSGAALVALLLSFGKFFPLYSFFYKLPVVNNIRNPNKFLQVFQVCLAILTAYGADRLFRSGGWRVASGNSSSKSKAHSLGPDNPASDLRLMASEKRRFFYFLSGVLALLVLWALGLTLDRSGDVSRFVAQGWPQDVARTIVQNKIAALRHASFMAAVITSVFAVFSLPAIGKKVEKISKHWKSILGAALVLIMAADAVKLSKHYVKEMPHSYIEANALTDFLKKKLGCQRVALATEQQLFGILKTYTLPYNGIPVFNPGDMSRMPVDYKNFLQAAQKDPWAMWEFSSVKYLLAPAGLHSQVSLQRVRKVFTCTVRPSQNGGFMLQPDMNGQIAVFELVNTLPRYILFAGSKKMTDREALSRIGDLSTLSLRPDSTFPELPGEGQAGRVVVESSRPGRIVLSVESDIGGILRCADRYTPGVTASVDERPAVVEPVDYICRGVFVPAGVHKVEVCSEFPTLFYYLRWIGYFIFLAACILAAGQRLKAAVHK